LFFQPVSGRSRDSWTCVHTIPLTGPFEDQVSIAAWVTAALEGEERAERVSRPVRKRVTVYSFFVR
jgi:hypothetical protein